MVFEVVVVYRKQPFEMQASSRGAFSSLQSPSVNDSALPATSPKQGAPQFLDARCGTAQDIYAAN